MSLAASGVGSWTPALLSSKQVWFDASGLSGADGDPIATLTDYYNGRNATSTSTARPSVKHAIQNGHSVLRFDGVNDEMSVSSQSASLKPLTFWAVCQADADGASDTLVGPSGIGGNHIRIDNAPVVRLDLIKSGTTVVGTSTVDLPPDWMIVVVTYDSSGNYAFRRNGTTEGSGLNNQTFTAARTLKIGNNEASEFYKGDIGEMGLHNAVLSTQEIAALTKYLSAKWGIATA